MKFAPDWRRILNELQRYSSGGSILEVEIKSNSFTELHSYIKGKDFKSMRQWVTNNIDTDATAIFRGLYDNAIDNLKKLIQEETKSSSYKNQNNLSALGACQVVLKISNYN